MHLCMQNWREREREKKKKEVVRIIISLVFLIEDIKLNISQAMNSKHTLSEELASKLL